MPSRASTACRRRTWRPLQLGATAAAAPAAPVESAALSSHESVVEAEDDGLADRSAIADAAHASLSADALRDGGAASAPARWWW